MDGEDARDQVRVDGADCLLGVDGDADTDADKDWTPLEDLDDAEFGLPPVDYTPSLEEILGADDACYKDLDDDETSLSNHLVATRSEANDGFGLALGSCALLDTLSLTSRGSGDSKSRTSSKFSKGRAFRKGKEKRGSIVRFATFRCESKRPPIIIFLSTQTRHLKGHLLPAGLRVRAGRRRPGQLHGGGPQPHCRRDHARVHPRLRQPTGPKHYPSCCQRCTLT